MSASVGFNCEYCRKSKGCKMRPKDNLKHMDRKSGWCFMNKKTAQTLAVYTFGKKRRGRPKKEDSQPLGENDNANV